MLEGTAFIETVDLFWIKIGLQRLFVAMSNNTVSETMIIHERLRKREEHHGNAAPDVPAGSTDAEEAGGIII